MASADSKFDDFFCSDPKCCTLSWWGGLRALVIYQLGLQSLVGLTLLGRFQVKGQTNCSTWASRLGVGRRANNASL